VSTIVGLLFALTGLAPTASSAQTLIDADFSKGDFAALGWKVRGDWDVFAYPAEAAQNPGNVARFAAGKPNGSLTKTFHEIRNPKRLMLSLEYGWGWGGASQGADAIAFELLSASGDGYLFKIHRCKATWAVQWGKVVNHAIPKDSIWASTEIDATHASIRDGGGLSHLQITRDSDGTWIFASQDWNQGAGASVAFNDSTTSSFSQLVLLGTENFDEQVFNKIGLADISRDAVSTTATPAAVFLESLGVNTTFPDRGQPLPKTVEMLQYFGFRWVRGGIEGLSSDGPTTLQTYLDLHAQTGVRFSWGLVSGGTDLKKLLETAQPLAKAGALLAFEGNNEPNNWGVTYLGEPGGGQAPSWLSVARLQRDLYEAVKSDPLLKQYPVWSISEGGGQTDNVGLQFLTIPSGADALLPAGTRFADQANVHNYIYHPGSPELADNKTWNAADPTSGCKVDGLYGNYGATWGKRFRGYTKVELMTLPRVTTETGCTIDGPVTEEIQALNLLSMYLDQFKRGWSHTAVYLLRDRTDEGGNQSFGLFRADYTPRKAAVYLHNLTAILADTQAPTQLRRLEYSIEEQPATMHELLLQKSDGELDLVIWNERLHGADKVTVRLGASYAKVKVFDPTIGVDSIQTVNRVDSISLTLSDHPLIVAISPE
jgi:hypothetical protein